MHMQTLSSVNVRIALNDPMSRFHDAIWDAGLKPPDFIERGKLHRFPRAGKRNGNTAGRCWSFEDSFGDWASGLSETSQAKREEPFSLGVQSDFRRCLLYTSPSPRD